MAGSVADGLMHSITRPVSGAQADINAGVWEDALESNDIVAIEIDAAAIYPLKAPIAHRVSFGELSFASVMGATEKCQ